MPAASVSSRAVAYLEAGPADSLSLARDVLGLPRARRAMAERLAAALVGADPRVTRIADGRWSLAPEAGSPALEACRFAVVDVETTGTRPRHGDRITEIAVARLECGAVTLAYERLVNPDVPIAPFITSLSGISDDLVRDAPRFDAVADGLLDALSGAVFVAHHVRFDWTFVSVELQRARFLLLQGPRLCTVRLARRLLPALPARNLDAVAQHFGIEIGRRHRAADDALATARILARLLGIAHERGAVTLADLGQVRNAEWGMRNERPHVDSALRDPHSAFE